MTLSSVKCNSSWHFLKKMSLQHQWIVSFLSLWALHWLLICIFPSLSTLQTALLRKVALHACWWSPSVRCVFSFPFWCCHCSFFFFWINSCVSPGQRWMYHSWVLSESLTLMWLVCMLSGGHSERACHWTDVDFKAHILCSDLIASASKRHMEVYVKTVLIWCILLRKWMQLKDGFLWRLNIKYFHLINVSDAFFTTYISVGHTHCTVITSVSLWKTHVM